MQALLKEVSVVTPFVIQAYGRFKMEVTRPDGSVRLTTEWFDNMVLDQGLNYVGTGGSAANYCRVGTGSTAPSASDSQLVSQVASATLSGSTSGYDNVGNLYGYKTSTYQFATGAAAGILAEVGVGWATTGTTLFSRALILDNTGSPTTITILSDEILTVTYEFRLYAPQSDNSMVVNISGTDYTFLVRSASIANWGLSVVGFLGSGMGTASQTGGSNWVVGYSSGTLGGITTAPGGSNIGNSTITLDGSYVNNSLQRKYIATWSISAATASIYNLAVNSYGGYFKASITPQIPKTNINVLTLNFTISWSRRTLP